MRSTERNVACIVESEGLFWQRNYPLKEFGKRSFLRSCSYSLSQHGILLVIYAQKVNKCHNPGCVCHPGNTRFIHQHMLFWQEVREVRMCSTQFEKFFFLDLKQRTHVQLIFLSNKIQTTATRMSFISTMCTELYCYSTVHVKKVLNSVSRLFQR